ncbi:MAG: DUF87 domain-containing protein, partial [Sulfolobales archaeon]
MIYSTYDNSNQIEDGVLLGRTSTLPRVPVYIKQTDFLRHCLIVGTTGSGKTSLAMKLANELKRYGASAVLDWYGEYSHV